MRHVSQKYEALGLIQKTLAKINVLRSVRTAESTTCPLDARCIILNHLIRGKLCLRKPELFEKMASVDHLLNHRRRSYKLSLCSGKRKYWLTLRLSQHSRSVEHHSVAQSGSPAVWTTSPI